MPPITRAWLTPLADDSGAGTDGSPVNKALLTAIADAVDGGLPATDAAAGVGSLRTLGTTGTSAAAGNDARLSDARAPTSHSHTEADVTGLVSDLGAIATSLALKAPLASPTLTGTPAAPTAAANDNTTKIATTAFVQTRDAVVALTDGATPALDASLGSWFRLAAAGNRIVGVPSNPRAGQKIIIEHFASGGIRTLGLNTGAGGFRFGTDIPALTATASGTSDYIGAVYNATATFWDVVAVTKGF